ncbi:MAG TPA: hypothetical protein VII89_03825, partial [Candidatus Dormibacteraeota bacterium]
MKSRILRGLGIIALLPLFGLVFCVAAMAASDITGLAILGVNVHGLGLASYAGDSAQRPAPLSLQLLDDAQRDSGGRVTALRLPATPSPQPTSTPRPAATPTPTA